MNYEFTKVNQEHSFYPVTESVIEQGGWIKIRGVKLE